MCLTRTSKINYGLTVAPSNYEKDKSAHEISGMHQMEKDQGAE